MDTEGGTSIFVFGSSRPAIPHHHWDWGFGCKHWGFDTPSATLPKGFLWRGAHPILLKKFIIFTGQIQLFSA